MGSDTSAGHPYHPGAWAGQPTAQSAPAAVNALRWRQMFPGDERELSKLRRWLASLLPDCPARDDVITVATELGTNALRHTASGRGGRFAVEVAWYQTVVRVAVADGGGPHEPHVIEDTAAEHGRGLLLVRGLSVRTGVLGDQRGRLVWADIAWDAQEATAPVSPPDPYEASIRDGEAALARRFTDVPAWFGRSTLAWWALTGQRGLVSAPSAQELAGALYRLLEDPPPSRAGARQHVPRNAAERHGEAAGPSDPRPGQGNSPALGSGRPVQPGSPPRKDAECSGAAWASADRPRLATALAAGRVLLVGRS